MLHLAGKTIPVENETEVYFDFENFENDAVIAAVLAFMWLQKNSKEKATN